MVVAGGQSAPSGVRLNGGFSIWGSSQSTTPLRIGLTNQSTFQDMLVNNAAEDNIVIEQTQNTLFESLWSFNAKRENMRIDYGAGGLRFHRCHFRGAEGASVL